MARRTYADIDLEVQSRLGNRSDITSNQRGFFINDAYLSIAMQFRHPEIEKIASAEGIVQGADSTIPIVQDIWYPTSLRNMTDGYLIRLDDQNRVERAQTKPTARPYTYYWYGKTFYFESFADTAKVLKIWYKRKPVDIANGVSELDQLFDPLIVMEAAKIGFETVRDFDEAAVQEKMITVWAEKQNLPVNMAKLNDYRQGFRVRFR